MSKVHEFLIPGQIPALKNNREAIIGKGQKFLGTRPAAEVEKFIRSTKDKFSRSLPSGFEVIRSPKEVAVVMLLGFYVAGYPKTLPKADMDNAATTLQECLFTAKSTDGPVLQDDRQVAEITIRRRIFNMPESVFNMIWVWEIDGDHSRIERDVMEKVSMWRTK